MTASTRIGRLTQRIEAVASRRWGRLTLEDLTGEGWAKITQLAAADPVEGRTDCSHWSTDALLRFLIDGGALTAANIKGRTV